MFTNANIRKKLNIQEKNKNNCRFTPSWQLRQRRSAHRWRSGKQGAGAEHAGARSRKIYWTFLIT